jgi:hypothetical protein
VLSHATTVLETVSLLREGFITVTCPEALDPRLIIQEGSDAAMYPEASDLASSFRRLWTVSSSRRGLMLPRLLRHRTSPHHLGGVRCYHASLGTESCQGGLQC